MESQDLVSRSCLPLPGCVTLHNVPFLFSEPQKRVNILPLSLPTVISDLGITPSFFICLFFLFILFPHSHSPPHSPLLIGDHSNMCEVNPLTTFVFILCVSFFCVQPFKHMKMVLCYRSHSASCFFHPKLCFRELTMFLYVYIAYCF